MPVDAVDSEASRAAPARLIVTYHGGATTRFDRGYCVDEHLPRTLDVWRPHGLEAASAFFSVDSGAGILAAGVYDSRTDFQDRAALRAALVPAVAAPVLRDVGRFTDARALRQWAVPLGKTR